MSNNTVTLNLGDRTFTLIGTAHVSEDSIKEVRNTITNTNCDAIAVEIDEKRLESVENKDKWRELDIIKVLKNKEGALLLSNLILASYQRKVGMNLGVKPGDELIEAIKLSKELNIPNYIIDRDIRTTLKRAWGKTKGSEKMQLLAILISTAFSSEPISKEKIEVLKQSSEMDSMMNEISQYVPNIKEVLIDERDLYLATKLWKTEGKRTIAVLGAGHIQGVSKHLQELHDGVISDDVSHLETVPPKSIKSKIIAWIIPIIIVGLIACGFYFGGISKGKNLALTWFLWNGILAALGCVIACGHPIAILSSFIGAPFTSLCPLIGVGLVSGLVQAVVCKPKVKDLEELREDSLKIKSFYKNRILKVLLVFFFSSIGSSIGTFIGGADIISKIAEMFIK